MKTPNTEDCPNVGNKSDSEHSLPLLVSRINAWTYRPRIIVGGIIFTALILGMIGALMATACSLIWVAISGPLGWMLIVAVGAIILIVVSVRYIAEWIFTPFFEWINFD